MPHFSVFDEYTVKYRASVAFGVPRYPWRRTMKKTLQLWSEAMTSQNADRHEEALTSYGMIENPSAHLRYNMACACVRLGQMETAIQVTFCTNLRNRPIDRGVHRALSVTQIIISFL